MISGGVSKGKVNLFTSSPARGKFNVMRRFVLIVLRTRRRRPVLGFAEPYHEAIGGDRPGESDDENLGADAVDGVCMHSQTADCDHSLMHPEDC